MTVVTYTAKVRKRIKGGWWWQVTQWENQVPVAAAGHRDDRHWDDDYDWGWRPTRKWAARKATRVADRLRDQATDQQVQEGQSWESA